MTKKALFLKCQSLWLVSCASLTLAGCAGLHSNVSGSFQCGAARGTCEPTMAIDDSALADIERSQRAVTPTIVAPLPYDLADLTSYPIRKAHVVFPGYQDDKGRAHEPYVVYVPLRDVWIVDDGPVVPISAIAQTPGRVGTDLRGTVAEPDGVDPASPPAAPIIVGRVMPASGAPVPAASSSPALSGSGSATTAAGAAPVSAKTAQSFPASTTVHP